MVYRVNELPLAFYDHIYDFGQLCNKAEDTTLMNLSTRTAEIEIPCGLREMVRFHH
jgi:hypothetical protein